MNYREFAKLVGVPHGTVKRWVNEGMPVYRGTRPPCIRRDGVDAALTWVRANKPDCISFSRESVVYFVRRESDGAIKVGFTSDLPRRLHELQKRTMCSIELIGTFPGDKRHELICHEKFRRLSIGREWFHPGDDIVDWFRANETLLNTQIDSPDSSPDLSPDQQLTARDVP